MPETALYRLLAWLSPSFPVGAYGYSHGLEAAAESGRVCDRATLEGWVGTVVAKGSGRVDADILRASHRAAAATDIAALDEANRRGLAYRATAELALESGAQGAAFLAACSTAWPEPFIERWAATVAAICYPAAVGAATARAAIALDAALVGYLQALAANLVSAGLAPRHRSGRPTGSASWRRWSRLSSPRRRRRSTAVPTISAAPPSPPISPRWRTKPNTRGCSAHDVGTDPLRIGIGGPVGSGKTALMDRLCKAMRDRFEIAAITNDIYTREDAEFLTRSGALPPERIRGVETGGCPHTAIREDASINLAAVAEMQPAVSRASTWS